MGDARAQASVPTASLDSFSFTTKKRMSGRKLSCDINGKSAPFYSCCSSNSSSSPSPTDVHIPSRDRTLSHKDHRGASSSSSSPSSSSSSSPSSSITWPGHGSTSTVFPSFVRRWDICCFVFVLEVILTFFVSSSEANIPQHLLVDGNGRRKNIIKHIRRLRTRRAHTVRPRFQGRKQRLRNCVRDCN